MSNRTAFMSSIGLAVALAAAMPGWEDTSSIVTRGDIVNTPGKAVLGSMALGAGQALDEMGRLDGLTEIRLDLIAADMEGDLRASLVETEQAAYGQAMRGEWSVDTLNDWIDVMIIDQKELSYMVDMNIFDLKEGHYTDLADDGAFDSILMGKSEAFGFAFEALMTVETHLVTGLPYLEQVTTGADLASSANSGLFEMGPDRALQIDASLDAPRPLATQEQILNHVLVDLDAIEVEDAFAGAFDLGQVDDLDNDEDVSLKF